VRHLDHAATVLVSLAGAAQSLLAQAASQPTDAIVGALINAGGLGLFSGAVFWLLRDHMARTAQQFDTITQRFTAELAADRALRESSIREVMGTIRSDHGLCRADHCAIGQRLELIERRQGDLMAILTAHIEGKGE